MPTYVYDGTAWQEVDGGIPTSTTTGDNIFVSSSNGSISTRILNVYVRDANSTWQTVYTAYVVPPPAKPSTPTWTSSRPSGWNTRVDKTRVSWNAVSGVSGYQLDIMDGSLNVIDTRFYAGGVTNSGDLPITDGGNVYYFRVYAYATNSAGTTYSNASTNLRVVSGSKFVPFTITKPDNYTTGFGGDWVFSKSANSTNCNVGSVYGITKKSTATDDNVSGYCLVDGVSYTLNDRDKIALYGSSNRYLQFDGTGMASEQFVGSPYSNLTVDDVPRTFDVSIVGGGTYKITAVGVDWFSRVSPCTAPSSYCVGFGLVINGYETTYNTT
jgi:hypothetical protein